MKHTAVFQQSYDFYKALYVNLSRIPKRDRFTWGERCERLGLNILFFSMEAETAQRVRKLDILQKLSRDIDNLKIFLRLGSELNIIDRRSYLARSNDLVSIGKMVGGWLKSMS